MIMQQWESCLVENCGGFLKTPINYIKGIKVENSILTKFEF